MMGAPGQVLAYVADTTYLSPDSNSAMARPIASPTFM